MYTVSEEVKRLIESLSDVLEEDERAEVVVFGSAAIALHGVDLCRDLDDLDIFVSHEVFERLSNRFPIETKPAKEGGVVRFIKLFYKCEVFMSFEGVEFDSVLSDALPLPGSSDLKVGALADLIAWKREKGRPKDLADVEAIGRQVP